ncbi:hypothetical protein Hanom_Chr06g00576591 [Helianthus anomalus]
MGKNTMMKRSIRMHSENTGNKAYLNLIPLLVLGDHCCYETVVSLFSSYLLQLLVFCKLQKVNLLMVEEYTELLVLSCYIYKFSMILKLPKSHRDTRYLKISVHDRYSIFYGINYLVCWF